MPRMFSEIGGYHNFSESDAIEAAKNGWRIITDEEWARIIAAKSGVAKKDEPATIPAQSPKTGRPRKGLSSILGVDNGDSTNDH